VGMQIETRRVSLKIALVAGLIGLAWSGLGSQDPEDVTAQNNAADIPKVEVATFGGGCFWCVEAVFQELDGVLSVESGYAGGNTPNPNYEDVCTETTGHAEVCQLRFDPSRIGYQDLLEVFWKTHDPTTLNRQGNDVGTQYRSVIFYHGERQKDLAIHYKKALDDSGAWDNPVVTAIDPFTAFYKAEDYHQNYYRSNPSAGYCLRVIRPKMEKFRKAFKEKLKKN